MPNLTDTGLTVHVHHDPEQGYYFYGVIQDGVFVTLASRPDTEIDAYIAEADSVAAGTWKPVSSNPDEPGSPEPPWWIVPPDAAEPTDAAPAGGPDEQTGTLPPPPPQ